MVAAVNTLLEKNLISLVGREEIGPSNEDGHLMAELFGHPSVIIWRDIGHQELSISVWWKYDHSKHPQANLSGNSREKFTTSSPLAKPQRYKEFVGVTVTGWLERKEGKFVQGNDNKGLVEIYTRTGEKVELERLPAPVPNGFASEGKVHI